ncbi:MULTISPECIES: hypothetical protein [unclassified Clostridium]|nr:MULTISPECIES: hypothetical protein [unclassified Clostridium]MBY7009420.1 hypothetical protein [Clostridium botulinum]
MKKKSDIAEDALNLSINGFKKIVTDSQKGRRKYEYRRKDNAMGMSLLWT